MKDIEKVVKFWPIEFQAAFDIERRFHAAALMGIDLCYPTMPSFDSELYSEAIK